MISIDFTILVQWLNFGVLVLILYFILFKPLMRFLDIRNERLRSDIEAARRTRRENEELNQQYQERLVRLKQESTDYINRARRQAEREKDKIIKEAHTEADRIILGSRKELKVQAEKAKLEVKKDMAGLVINCASQVLEREVKETDHKKMIHSFLEGETSDE